MMNILTFIIPVRHPENTNNWGDLQRKLSETIRSIASQDTDGWKAIIVANNQAQLPDLPKSFEVKRVDFAPNPIFGKLGDNKEQFYDAIRLDKGRRVLAGMLHAGQMGHVMIVDDDDLISRRITSFVKTNSGENGWYIPDGYVWNDGGVLMYRYCDFSRLCGTSHIIRADLYQLPSSFKTADEGYIRRWLGSHIFLHDTLDAAGTPLKPLPFIGAVYRVGHAQAHSLDGGIFKRYFKHRSLLKNPVELMHRISRLQIKTRNINKEFFGL